ncbi:MAG: DUF2807 domain-containing protein [Rikenellaceae bacterium]|nr:DUF2807 domain-containing protein [Rikenellaceae bacterium]
MAKIILTLILVASMFVLSFGQSPSKLKIKGSAKQITTVKSIDAPFNSVNVSIDGSVELIPSRERLINLTSYDNHHEYIVIKQEGNVLYISYAKGVNLTKTKNTVVIMMSDPIESVVNNGTASVTIKVPVTDEFDVKTTGSGKLTAMNVVCDKIFINIAGSGPVYLTGECSEIDIVSSGRSAVDCEYLTVNQARISQTGSGSIVVAPYRSLWVNTVGAGTVYYIGDPEIYGNTTSRIMQKQ